LSNDYFLIDVLHQQMERIAPSEDESEEERIESEKNRLLL
jgi:hypothetical protein